MLIAGNRDYRLAIYIVSRPSRQRGKDNELGEG